MLYRTKDLSKYEIRFKELEHYMKRLTAKGRSERFITYWTKAMQSIYESNVFDRADTGDDFAIQTVKITERCTFQMNYNLTKLEQYSRYYDAKTFTAAEFAEKKLIIYKSCCRRKSASALEDNNPTVVIIECPCGVNFKKVAILGTNELESRLKRHMRIDCVEIPRQQVFFSLSQPFEKAWYKFLIEFNEYIKLETPIERKRFLSSSACMNYV